MVDVVGYHVTYDLTLMYGCNVPLAHDLSFAFLESFAIQ